ncbi:hypothetical protein Goshw_027441 [Gossypium schwendimanii]|uniref:Uncharacterized protein n=1 Tax=Gossypium schwendimanii TaxID=34291 RepID=A0A7J9KNR8_GOSSC|nr:hypothetical protein [Gossypium schwendimanii]
MLLSVLFHCRWFLRRLQLRRRGD